MKASRCESRLGNAFIGAQAGDGGYRIEIPIDEANAYLRRITGAGDTLQVRWEADRLAVRLVLDLPYGPYPCVLRGRIGVEGGAWRSDDASGSVGRTGIWRPAAAWAFRREAPRAVAAVFPGRIESLAVVDTALVVSGRIR